MGIGLRKLCDSLISEEINYLLLPSAQTKAFLLWLKLTYSFIQYFFIQHPIFLYKNLLKIKSCVFDIFSRYDTTSQSSVVVKKDYNRDFEKMPSLK